PGWRELLLAPSGASAPPAGIVPRSAIRALGRKMMSSNTRFDPRTIPLKNVRPETPAHVFGMHLVQYGEREGNCICTAPCFQNAGGCTCPQCAGIGHVQCRQIREARWRRRAAKEAKSDA